LVIQIQLLETESTGQTHEALHITEPRSTPNFSRENPQRISGHAQDLPTHSGVDSSGCEGFLCPTKGDRYPLRPGNPGQGLPGRDQGAVRVGTTERAVHQGPLPVGGIALGQKNFGIARGRLRRYDHPAGSAHPRSVNEGIPFLGFKIFPDHRRVKQRKGFAYRRKLGCLRQIADQKTIHASVQGWINHVRYADTYHLRESMLKEFDLLYV